MNLKALDDNQLLFNLRQLVREERKTQVCFLKYLVEVGIFMPLRDTVAF